MNILIIKTSSLGDIVHTLPALTDAGEAIPDIHFDWVVEESFADIPTWHPLVDHVIPIAIRRWRKTPIKSLFSQEVRDFKEKLRQRSYDTIIDAQGLLKSALLTKMARGYKIGQSKQSLKEPLARFAYQRTVDIDKTAHAVHRMRDIFAKALNYPLPDKVANYQLNTAAFDPDDWTLGKYIVLLHGTTRPTKHWPDGNWQSFAKMVEDSGYHIRIPWHSTVELERAEKIAASCQNAHLIPRGSLSKLAAILSKATAAITVDTGLGHLSAALNTPTIALYGPTNPTHIGTLGAKTCHLIPDHPCRFCYKPICTYKSIPTSSACLEAITPERVFSVFLSVISRIPANAHRHQLKKI